MIAKPRYQQLKDAIVARISAGQLRPGDRVPSENELVVEMNVSRMTANRALRELTDEGFVERVAGRGTYVAEPRVRSHVREVQNIADEIASRGNVHAARVVRRTRAIARGEVGRALDLPAGSEVLHLVVVHQEGAVPIQVEDRYVCEAFAPDCLDQDYATTTPAAYLTSIAPLQEAEQLVRARMPGQRVRKLLAMGEAEPELLVIRRTWAGGRPVSFARLHHPGSRYELAGHYRPQHSKAASSAEIVQLEAL